MNHRVLFSPDAQNDLLTVDHHIAEQAGDTRALAYIEPIERQCAPLERFPQRGTRRDDVRPGLRIIGFERRATIAFQVSTDTVTIVRVLDAGRVFGESSAEKPWACATAQGRHPCHCPAAPPTRPATDTNGCGR